MNFIKWIKSVFTKKVVVVGNFSCRPQKNESKVIPLEGGGQLEISYYWPPEIDDLHHALAELQVRANLTYRLPGEGDPNWGGMLCDAIEQVEDAYAVVWDRPREGEPMETAVPKIVAITKGIQEILAGEKETSTNDLASPKPLTPIKKD